MPTPDAHLLSNDSPTRGRFSWLLSHSALILGLVVCIATCIGHITRPDRGDWVRCYMIASRRMLHHEAIHRLEPDLYPHPPCLAMLFIPFANLSNRAATIGCWGMNMAAGALLVTCAWQLAGGVSLRRLSKRWLAVFWITAFLAGRFVLAPIENRQTDLLIAAVLVAGCLSLWRGRDLAGGALVGLAASMKCTPLIFAPYLVWRGKYKSALAMMLALVLADGLPDMLFTQSGGGSYVTDWYKISIGRVANSEAGHWYSDAQLNQSLAGLINRWVGIGSLDALKNANDPTAAETPQSVHPTTRSVARYGLYGTCLILLGITYWSFRKPFQPAPCVGFSGTAVSDICQLQLAIESGALMCLMLLFSPMSGKAHYVVLWLPVLLIARLAIVDRLAWPRVIIGVLAITGPLTAKGLLGKTAGDLTLVWGFPTFFALATLVGMWCALASVRRLGHVTQESPAQLTVTAKAA